MRRIRRNILKHLRNLRRELAASGLAFALLSGCGGGSGAPGMSSQPLPTLGRGGTFSLSLQVPRPSLQANRRSPKYVSPDTQYIGISYLSGVNQPFTSAQLDAPQVNFQIGSPAVCATQSNGAQFCTVAVSLSPGTYTIAVTTWAAAPTSGVFKSTDEISQTILPSEYIAPGSLATPGAPNIEAALDAIASSIQITALPGQSHVVADGNAFELIGTTPTNFLVEPVDAAGDIIIGGAPNGEPTVTLAADAAGDTSVVPNTTNPNEFTVQVVAYNSAPISLVATATPVFGSGLPATSTTLAVQTVQELWLSNTNSGAALGGIAGFPLFPPASGSTGFTPPYVGGNAVPVDSALCDGTSCAPTQNLAALAVDPVATSTFPNGSIWAMSLGSGTPTFGGPPPPIVSYPIPSTNTDFIPTFTTIQPTTSYQSPTGTLDAAIAADASGNIWLLDSYNGFLEEYSPPSYAQSFSEYVGFATLYFNTTSDIAIPQRGPLAGDLVFIGEPAGVTGNSIPEVMAIHAPFSAATSSSAFTVATAPGFTPQAFAISPDGNTLWIEGGGQLEYFTVGTNGVAALVSVPASLNCVDPSATTGAPGPGVGSQVAVSYNGTVWTVPASTGDGACEYQYTGSAIGWTNSVVYYQGPGGTAQQNGIAITP